MPLDLTDAELATAPTARRAMAYQEGERARKLENVTESNKRDPATIQLRCDHNDRSISPALRLTAAEGEGHELH
jgi:hypothetical protein